MTVDTGAPPILRVRSCSDLVNLEKATEAYERAAEMYAEENQKSAANSCLVKAAQFYAQNEKYREVCSPDDKPPSTILASYADAALCHHAWTLVAVDPYQAIKLYTELGKASIDNALTRWSVKDYFFKAGICYLCNEDLEGCRKALDQFDNLDSTFSSSREAKFLKVRGCQCITRYRLLLLT